MKNLFIICLTALSLAGSSQGRLIPTNPWRGHCEALPRGEPPEHLPSCDDLLKA